MKLTQIGISRFRSIGEEPVMIDLAKKVTVLVGQNDCGKSNVLRGMERLSRLPGASGPNLFLQEDYFNQKGEVPRIHLVADTRESPDWPQPRVSFEGPFAAGFASGCHCVDIEVRSYTANIELFKSAGVFSASSSPDENQNRLLCFEIGTRTGASLLNDIPRCELIPQYRKIDSATEYKLDGTGIVRLLASWQVPEKGQDHLRGKFNAVVRFLRQLLECSDIELEVPPSQTEIFVRQPTLRLPLESHGTGIHQLIILAIAALSQENVIFGIEEPEVHLHPVLQKRFLDFLRKETNNTYIITTHSPALISPAEDVDVIHLKMVDGVTIPHRISTDRCTLDAIADLGIRASDLLQANSVVWVEGPSDRIYLKRWLKIVAPDLTEGIDFSIMFYGGRLLSHLKLAEGPCNEAVDGFINLLRINQYSAVVMDSDREKGNVELNRTKKRIIDECQKNGLHAWVTAGQEIENYLSPTIVRQALEANCKRPNPAPFSISNYRKLGAIIHQAYGGKTTSPCDYDADKVTWAHRFVSYMSDNPNDLSDNLREHLGQLVDFIRKRNATPSAGSQGTKS